MWGMFSMLVSVQFWLIFELRNFFEYFLRIACAQHTWSQYRKSLPCSCEPTISAGSDDKAVQPWTKKLGDQSEGRRTYSPAFPGWIRAVSEGSRWKPRGIEFFQQDDFNHICVKYPVNYDKVAKGIDVFIRTRKSVQANFVMGFIFFSSRALYQWNQNPPI